MLKRSVDLVLALIGLIILFPLFALVAAAIKIDSPGTVFFKQKRVGVAGVLFDIFKFRTMVSGAYKMGSRLTVKRDPRITRVGQILRWLKIDELPQLINVLLGEMSMIGPRPEDPYFVGFYDAEQRRVLSVRPGIVGPSQIEGRDELESYPEGVLDTEKYYLEHILPEKLGRDLVYVENATFIGDCRLLLHGIWATIVGAIKTKYLWRRRRRLALMGVDMLLSGSAFLVAYLLRFEWQIPDDPLFLLQPLLLIMLVRPLMLLYFGLYQGIFAYFGMYDMMALFRAVTVGSLAVAGLTFLAGLQNFPRSVLLLDCVFALVLLGGLRAGLRQWVRRHPRSRKANRENVIIIGAGLGGEQISRAMLEDPIAPYRPVGFIDTSPERWGSLIHGVKVLGGSSELPLAINANAVKTVFVCLSDVDGSHLEQVTDMCRKAGVECRFVPTLTDWLNTDAFRFSRREAAHEHAA
ncbi:MAG TPA: sugar transferase [Vicinamibacterales bacterium]|nr:sugar transferase [Vicinamibacterales bacterium]